METSQRYIVRELTGWTIGPGAATAGSQPPTTEVMVLDRWDCCHVVASFSSRNHHVTLDQRRLSAEALARKLEQDHRRWFSRGAPWPRGMIPT